MVKTHCEPFYHLNELLPRKFVLPLMVKYLVRSIGLITNPELGLGHPEEGCEFIFSVVCLVFNR